MKNRKFLKVSARFVMLLTLIFYFSGCKAKAEPKVKTKTKPPVAVRITPVKIGAFERKLNYIGSVKSSKEVKIYSRVNGTILSIMKKEGETVKKGKPIVKMSVPDLGKRLQRLYSEIKRAKIESQYLCYQNGKDKNLYKEHVISKSKLDYSTLKCKASKQAISSAYAGYSEVSVIKKRGLEKSPIDGVVLKRFVQSGENIFPGKPIVLIGNYEQEIFVNVSEQDVKKGIKLGTPVKVFINGDNNKENVLLSTVSKVDPMAWGPGRLVEVRVKLPSTIKRLTYGSSVKVSFILETHKSSTYVPTVAVKKEKSGNFIFIANGNIIKEVKISLGLEDNGNSEILSPVLKSESVIITNIDSLKNGETIYPVKTDWK